MASKLWLYGLLYTVDNDGMWKAEIIIIMVSQSVVFWFTSLRIMGSWTKADVDLP